MLYQLYLDCNRAGDVLQYWEQQRVVFPRLYTITRKVFCDPDTTAGVLNADDCAYPMQTLKSKFWRTVIQIFLQSR